MSSWWKDITEGTNRIFDSMVEGVAGLVGDEDLVRYFEHRTPTEHLAGATLPYAEQDRAADQLAEHEAEAEKEAERAQWQQILDDTVTKIDEATTHAKEVADSYITSLESKGAMGTAVSHRLDAMADQAFESWKHAASVASFLTGQLDVPVSVEVVQAAITALSEVEWASVRETFTDVFEDNLLSRVDVVNGDYTQLDLVDYSAAIAAAGAAAIGTLVAEASGSLLKGLVSYVGDNLGVILSTENVGKAMMAISNWLITKYFVPKAVRTPIPANVLTAIELLAQLVPPEVWQGIISGVEVSASTLGPLLASGWTLGTAVSEALAGMGFILDDMSYSPNISYESIDGADYVVVSLGPINLALARDPKQAKGRVLQFATSLKMPGATKKIVKGLNTATHGLSGQLLQYLNHTLSKEAMLNSIQGRAYGGLYQLFMSAGVNGATTIASVIAKSLKDVVSEYAVLANPAHPSQPVDKDVGMAPLASYLITESTPEAQYSEPTLPEETGTLASSGSLGDSLTIRPWPGLAPDTAASKQEGSTPAPRIHATRRRNKL